MGKGGRKGGITPHLTPERQKKVLPLQTNNLFTTVPPYNWLAAGGGRKKDYFCSKLPKFAAFWRLSRQFSGFVSPPFPPSERRNLFPPPGCSKTTPPPPAKIWLIPLPVADPTPTYGEQGIIFSRRGEEEDFIGKRPRHEKEDRGWGVKKKPFSPHYKKLTEVAWKVIHIAITDLFCHLCHKNDDADVFPARDKKTFRRVIVTLFVLLRRGALI